MAELNTKIVIELETGKQKKNPEKTWEGIRVRIGDVTRVLFVTSRELEIVRKVLDENK